MREENFGRMNLAPQNSAEQEPEWEENEIEEAPEEEKPKKRFFEKDSQLVTLVQIGLCAVILAAALVLKLIGGGVYETSRSWYFAELDKSVIAGTAAEQGEKALQDIASNVGKAVENLGEKILV